MVGDYTVLVSTTDASNLTIGDILTASAALLGSGASGTLIAKVDFGGGVTALGIAISQNLNLFFVCLLIF